MSNCCISWRRITHIIKWKKVSWLHLDAFWMVLSKSTKLAFIIAHVLFLQVHRLSYNCLNYACILITTSTAESVSLLGIHVFLRRSLLQISWKGRRTPPFKAVTIQLFKHSFGSLWWGWFTIPFLSWINHTFKASLVATYAWP